MATQSLTLPPQPLNADTPLSGQLALAGGYSQASVGGRLLCSSWSTYSGALRLVVDSSTDGGGAPSGPWVNELDQTWAGGALDHHGNLPGASVVYADGIARTIRATITASAAVAAGATITETTTP